MEFNLIFSNWLPIIRQSGTRERIAPWQLTAPADDPPVLLDFPRPDFAAAVLEMLIGLMQTCMPPASPREWRSMERQPPAPDVLRQAMEPHAEAFHLFGKAPCFLQDLELLSEQSGKEAPIAALLIESPGDNTIKQNRDFFVKRGLADRLCPACAAAALITMQAFAPAGGQGHRTSLRGGGPLSTTVAGETLWQSVWRNVLEMRHLRPLGDMDKPQAGGVFPWLAPTVTSEKDARPTTPADVHPLHMYWAMPRRIRLIAEEAGAEQTCSICTGQSEVMVTRYATQPRGYNYEGGFQHPLTPTAQDGNKPPYHLHGSPAGIRFRNWLGLVDHWQQGNKRRAPALALQVFRQERARIVRDLHRPDYRILAQGYDMDNMKARAWNQGLVPVYEVKPEMQQDFAAAIARLVHAASEVKDIMRSSLRKALFDPKKELPPDNTVLANLDARFWNDAEPGFYQLLPRLREVLENQDTAGQQELAEQWLQQLCNLAHSIYEDAVLMSQFDAFEDQRHQARAWTELRNYASPRNNKLRTLLDLPKLRKEKPQPAQ